MIIEAGPLTTIWEVVEELNINNFIVVRNLKQIGKVKKLDKWVPHELTANQKNHYFEVSSLILCNDIKPFLVVCDVRWKVDFVQQPVMTSSVFGLRRSSEALPKARPVPKKIMVTCLVVFCPSVYTAFWIPVKPLHLRSMLSKSMKYTENCNSCNPSIGPWKGLISPQ